jgi:ribosomal protein L32
MFGFGFSKLAVLIGIVIAVWYGFKFVGQLDKARKQSQSNKPPRRSAGGGGSTSEVEDTVQCPICGAYVVANSASPCERPDCPY